MGLQSDGISALVRRDTGETGAQRRGHMMTQPEVGDLQARTSAVIRS